MEGNQTGDGSIDSTNDESGLRQRHKSSSDEASHDLPKPGTTPNGKKLMGVTPSGLRFELPKSKAPFEYHSIPDWNLFDWIKYSSGLNTLMLFTNTPTWFLIVWFLFWRLAYNAGIGYLLHIQSQKRALTSLFSKYRTNPWTKWFFKVEKGASHKYLDLPDEYNAWVVFRRVVDVILANDLVTYIVFVLRCYEPNGWSWGTAGLHVLGAVLCYVALWGKTDAYRVVGTFAWYWGDFFFLVDQSLTFDRVFAIAPHPMYTLGYGFFYGAALITQSYAVFIVSLVAHVLQLLFLEAVENPHIEKTYTDVKEEDAKKQQQKELSDSTQAYLKNDLMVVKHFTPFRSSDLVVMALILLHVMLLALRLPLYVYLCMCIYWRLFHSLFCGGILYLQAKDQFWTRHSLEQGMTKPESFENWKRIYNLSLVVYYVSLVTASVAAFSHETAYHALIGVTAGVVLICLNIWSSLSVFEVLGEFGWFYGDFFLDSVPWQLKYDGIYRFLNNPESTLGYAGHYGLALCSGSLHILAVSIFAHATALLFVRWVEEPFMQQKYGIDRRPIAGAEGAVRSLVKEKLDELSEQEDLMKLVKTASNNFDRVKLRATEQLREILPNSLNSLSTKRRSQSEADLKDLHDTASGSKKKGK